MCIITVKTYVFPDGRRESVEDKRFCGLSDKVNPCYNHKREIQAEVIIASNSGFPGLAFDDIATPLSISHPTTPVSFTPAPKVELRHPGIERHPSHHKDKGKRRVLDLSDLTVEFGKKNKKHPSKHDRSSRCFEEEEIIAVEEDIVIKPIAPCEPRPWRPDPCDPTGSIPIPPPPPIPMPPMPQMPEGSQGSPYFPSGAPRPRVEIHQPNPPYPGSSPNPGHRRNFTAPEPIDMPRPHSDNEVWERAAARERLRQEDRDRKRADDARRSVQEEKERRELAEDEFSAMENERIQGREELRQRARESREKEHKGREKEQLEKRIQEELEQREIERITIEIDDAGERRDRKAARRAEHRAAKLAAEQRRQCDASRELESELEAQLARMHRRNEESYFLETQENIARLEQEIREAQRERRVKQARERRLLDEIHNAERLQSEIHGIEGDLRQMTIDTNDAEIRWREDQLRYGDDERYYSDRIDGPRFGERRNLSYRPSSSPRRSPTYDLIPSRSPSRVYRDPEFRRLRGAEVLEREWAIGAQNQVAGDGEMPRLSPRRYSTGGNWPRDVRYRRQFRRYI